MLNPFYKASERLALVMLVSASFVAANPDKLSQADGRATFRANCGFCHGSDGRGGRGPALANGRFLNGSGDEDIKAVIRSGIAGTNMPAFEFEDEELDTLVKYIRSLSSSAGAPQSKPVPGTAALGRLVYKRNGCASCHRISAEGSVYGPDLTRVGAGRSPEYIRQSILNPSDDISDDYTGITVTERDGRRTTGIRINEDTFTIQLRDFSQRFRMFQKDQLQRVEYETKSLMPAFDSLSPEDVQNLVAYLASLQGELKAGAAVRKGAGLR